MARVGAISLGLGLTTAFATELTITPDRPGANEAFEDPQYRSSGWSYFDPGFLVDHLPFKLTVGQSFSYSDNVANLPSSVSTLTNASLAKLPSRGDFYSDTTMNVASRFPMGAQTFFFNGTYAPRRYFRDSDLDADNYSINGGVDFNVLDRCSGRLIGGTDRHQNPLEESAAFGLQTVTETSFNASARCKLTGHTASLFNSGVSKVSNSNDGLDLTGIGDLSANDYKQYYVGGGFEYALTSLDTFRGTITYSHRDFTNRTATSGLAPSTDQIDYQAYYSRIFSAKLDGSATGGLSTFTTPLSNATASEPIYSFQLNYRPTPKLLFSGIYSHTAGVPQQTVSDLQVNTLESLSVSYTFSPKITLTGLVSHNQSQNPTLSSSTSGSSSLYANVESKNASVVLNYRASPLLTATAAYSYVSRTDTSRVGYDAVSNVFRVGLVYTR